MQGHGRLSSGRARPCWLRGCDTERKHSGLVLPCEQCAQVCGPISIAIHVHRFCVFSRKSRFHHSESSGVLLHRYVVDVTSGYTSHRELGRRTDSPAPTSKVLCPRPLQESVTPFSDHHVSFNVRCPSREVLFSISRKGTPEAPSYTVTVSDPPRSGFGVQLRVAEIHTSLTGFTVRPLSKRRKKPHFASRLCP